LAKRPLNKFVRKAIREIMEPAIRALGFEGKYPNFKRIEDGEIHFLEISTAKYGGGFGYGFSWCENGPLGHGDGEAIPADQIERTHIPFAQSAGGSPLMDVWTLDGERLRVSAGDYNYELIIDDEDACRELVTEAAATLPQADSWLKTRGPQELVFLAGHYPPTGYSSDFALEIFRNKEDFRLRALGLID